MKTVITKGEFARRHKRGPSAVSNWIAAGKISQEALIGKGNAAKIWLERAEADLAASLDPSQQLMQQSPILPSSPAMNLPASMTAPRTEPTAPAPPGATIARPPPNEREQDLARRAKADADRAEHDAEAARRKLLIDEGKYVVAEDAAREWGRELARLVSEIETFMSSTLSRELAAKHHLDWKALSVEMREAFRNFRTGLSEEARRKREVIATDDVQSEVAEA